MRWCTYYVSGAKEVHRVNNSTLPMMYTPGYTPFFLLLHTRLVYVSTYNMYDTMSAYSIIHIVRNYVVSVTTPFLKKKVIKNNNKTQ